MNDSGDRERVTSDEERARALLKQLKSVHAFDLAYETIVGLLNFGTQKMGLSEETRPVRDLTDARLSIELIRATLEVVEREQGDERTRGLRDALAQMQLAYGHAVQLANAERAAAPDAGEGEAAAGETGEGEAAPDAGDRETAPDAGDRVTAPDVAEATVGETGEPAEPKQPAGTKRPAAKKKPAGGS